MKAVFIGLIALTSVSSFASDFFNFQIENPETGKMIDVRAYSAFSVDPHSEIELLRGERSVEKLRSLRFPVVFTKGIEATAYTFHQSLPTSATIAEKLNRDKDLPAIVLSYGTDFSALIHEIQHADDYHTAIESQIESKLRELSGVSRVNPHLVLVVLEWRAYSKQTAAIEELGLAEPVGSPRVTFMLNGYLNAFQSLSAYFQRLGPDSLKAYCSFLRTVHISNQLLTVQYVAPSCE